MEYKGYKSKIKSNGMGFLSKSFRQKQKICVGHELQFGQVANQYAKRAFLK